MYFINLDNISIEYSSDYTVYSVNNNAFDNNTSTITNKEIYLFTNKNKYNLISIDLYGNKPNIVQKYNSEYSNRLSIIKYLEF